MQIKLYLLMKENKETIKGMAKILGITEQQFSKKLHSKAQFTQDEMFFISEHYNSSVIDIFLPRNASKCGKI